MDERHSRIGGPEPTYVCDFRWRTNSQDFRFGSVVRAMTSIDDALELDRAIPDIDWHVFPAGTVHDVFTAPSGGLARVRLGEPEAPRVVLISGVAGSKEDFILLFPLFAAAGYRVESYDIAGHYGSVNAGPQNLDPPREEYDYRLFVDDLIAILEDGRTPAHVLGYSFAGLVAELALVERPDLFASLTLMAAPPATGQVFRGVKHIGPISDMPPHRAAGLILWGIRYNLNRTPPLRIAFVRERMAVTGRPVIDDVVGTHDGHARHRRRGRSDRHPEVHRGRRGRISGRRSSTGRTPSASARASRCIRPATRRARPLRTSSCATCWRCSPQRLRCSVRAPGEAPALRMERGRR